MKYHLVAIFALIAPIFARPQAPPQPQAAAPQHAPVAAQPHPQPNAASGGATTPVTIVNQAEVIGPDGSFNYSYDTSNGIHVEQGGYVKQGAQPKSVDPNNPDAGGDVQVIQGAFSYTAPDGQEISLKYVADDNGFQPQGDHLPTAPPVPEGIARSLEQQPQQPGQPAGQPGQPLQHQQPQALAAAVTDHPSPVTQV
ncbi:hypothetical protein Zmor_013674 [Zophobas morio]|uniref:Uncharacterized protein n=1 Tax=Zophobas morio TaxID=2755281 RepID=A0AA38MFA5_9CUCU|nr:hypothetical protein Zmor_013674 [Zophobas morio]